MKKYIKNNKYWLVSLLLCLTLGELINRIYPNISFLLAAAIGAVIGIAGVSLDKRYGNKIETT